MLDVTTAVRDPELQRRRGRTTTCASPARIEAAGELLRIDGADWDLEIGTLAEIVCHARPEPPAVLFENMPGYPGACALLSGATNSSKRLAIALGLPEPKQPLDVVRAYRDRMKTHAPIPPRVVNSGPVWRTSIATTRIDLFKFPVPRLHELDGGRYIGTDDLVIMRDPEETGSTPRPIAPGARQETGRHVDVARQARPADPRQIFRAGKPCPVLISCGHDPLLFLAGGNEVKFGVSRISTMPAAIAARRSRWSRASSTACRCRPMPRSCSKARWRPTRRRSKGRSASSPATTPEPERAADGARAARLLSQQSDPHAWPSPMRPPSDFSFSKCVIKSA